jgi:hypothetical protein
VKSTIDSNALSILETNLQLRKKSNTLSIYFSLHALHGLKFNPNLEIELEKEELLARQGITKGTITQNLRCRVQNVAKGMDDG